MTSADQKHHDRGGATRDEPRHEDAEDERISLRMLESEPGVDQQTDDQGAGDGRQRPGAEHRAEEQHQDCRTGGDLEKPAFLDAIVWAVSRSHLSSLGTSVLTRWSDLVVAVVMAASLPVVPPRTPRGLGQPRRSWRGGGFAQRENLLGRGVRPALGQQGSFPVARPATVNDCCGMDYTRPTLAGSVHAPSADAAPVPASRGRGPLNAILGPRSIAVIGATERSGSVGSAVMRNVLDGGFSGPIVPVNRHRTKVFGEPAYPRIGDSPTPVDLAVICTPASGVAGVVRECGEAGVRGIVILSAGFRETGVRGIELERCVRAELDRFPRMRVLGPNCVGVIVPSRGINASFARTGVKPGGVALLSQSGALCTALLGWAQDEGIGFSHFVSVGNMLDVGFGDLLDHLAGDAQTSAIVLYLEAIKDGERFLAAARRCTAHKPVIAYKAGRDAAGARAAASHTGAMAGEDAVYQAAFDEVGIVRVDRLDALLATAELLGRRCRPTGPRLAIVTNAGGPGVIATDALVRGKGVLADLSDATLDALSAFLPGHWSHANPVDVIGDAPPERLASAVNVVLGDPAVDAVVTIVTPQSMIDTTAAARSVAAAAAGSEKPMLAVWMGGSLVREGTELLQAAHIPAYGTPEQAIEAFLHLAAHSKYARDEASRVESAGSPPTTTTSERQAAAERLVGDRQGALGEADSKALLSLYGVATVETHVARSRGGAVASAARIGYPVALKVISPQVTHKTDVGGVVLDVRSDEEAAAAFDRIHRSVSSHRPAATIEGVTVQRMLDRSEGVELIVGVKRDATFGPVVLVGAGGTAAEVLGDRAIGLAPVDKDRARQLLSALRIAPLFDAFRGRPAVNMDALADLVAGMSTLIAEAPGVIEAEANPVLVTPGEAVALDGRVITGLAASAPQ